MKNRRRNAGNGQTRSSSESEPREIPNRAQNRGASSRVQMTARPSTSSMKPYATGSTLDWPLGRELMTYPIDMLRRFRTDMDRFFEDMGSVRSSGGRQSMSVWSPRAEMFDRNGHTVVRVELPGLEKDDVKVSVWNDRLIVEGERREEDEQRGRDYYQSEWSYGRFYREIPLPETIDAPEVQASFKNGVLEIELPQSSSSHQRRQVTIS